ncbi:type IV pilus modification PilV family protein [Moraxella bovis]|uniref:Tfp pilus assembly protein PilV n=1 Tax=Moraxella bovis TaxID=476 RepID=A0A378PXB9_MORBO|nr:prepilin-type N-terminal cleavage/methylation domain-containing protein [Moraxella bovis]UYZ73950.1 type IV pilus modification protein PilV [Moraxella bovis]UYZ94530.1 type IV pilus modification protein PilV [Moraxella bovis]UZA13429.1 type IV pilus modification protein PilV [Moraxella bovis]UZA20204.1 type IV pilus modification protein PilV [Moraxella bovis]UZA28216.1 type IV pilus modification protein PilV [Moraxella bovis]
MTYKSLKNQQGIGIVEVMVALMLLAIAVLGFSAMQLAAVKSTDESLMRTRALAVMRGAAENMRGYGEDGIGAFATALNGNARNTDGCMQSGNSLNYCTVAQLAAKDAATLNVFATSQGMTLRLVNCPGTAGGQVRRCMIAAWGKTKATLGSGRNDCANEATGIQNSGASCFVMEAY